VTSLCTVIGALPGALPPVIGYAAASGTLSPMCGVVFAILFLWQLPHFMAIAWLYREDYARAGMPMVPVLPDGARRAGRQAVGWSLTLLVVSLLPQAMGSTGSLYTLAALVLGGAYCGSSIRFFRNVTRQTARELFWVSLVHLPLLLTVLALDAVRVGGS
jgi:protoheme IX farnesyltransferase